MIKEIKYIFYTVSIFLFIFLILNYYYSDKNKKKSFRSLSLHDKKIENQLKNIEILQSDTENIIEYIDKNLNPKKEKFHFWNLIDINES